MLKIIDVALIVTMRVDELASETAAKPSSTARSAAKRNTAIATLNIVSAVRRLLRRALIRTRPMNFIAISGGPERAALHSPLWRGPFRPAQPPARPAFPFRGAAR